MTEDRGDGRLDAGGALTPAWATAVFLVALGVRLAAFLSAGRSLAFAKYLEGGALLAEGRLSGTQVLDFSPLYLELHAIPYRLGLVPDLDVVRVAQCVVGAVTCVVVAATGAMLAGRAAGVTAGLLAAVQRNMVLFDQVLEPETLLIATVSCALLLALRARGRDEVAARVGAGALAAAAAATRPTAVLVVPILAAVASPGPDEGAVEGWSRVRRVASRVGLVLAGFALVHGAFAIRDRSYAAGMSMSPGQVLFTGNNPSANGVWRADFLVKDVEAQTLNPPVADFAHEVFRQVAVASGADPSDPDRYWQDLALAFIREYPLRWLALAGEKALALGQPHEPHDLASAIALDSRLASWPLLGAWPLVALGAGGLVVARRRLWPVAGLALAQAAVCLAFFVSARHRTALMPWVCLGAAVLTVDLLRASRRRAALAGVVIAVVLAVLFRLPLPPGHALAAEAAEARATHATYAEAAALRADGRHVEAAARLEECVAEAPWFADLFALAEVPLPLDRIGAARAPAAVERARESGRARDWLRAGMLLEFGGARAAAIAAFERAEEAAIWPGERPTVHAALVRRGAALLASGRTAEAAEAFGRASALSPGEPEALVGLAVATGDPGALARAEAVNPGMEVAYLHGRTLLDAGRAADAIEPLGRVVGAIPGWPRARMLLGLALSGAGRVREGAAEIARAQAAFPELFDPLHVPVDAMRRAAEERPGDATALRRLATFAAVYGDFATAIETWLRLDGVAGLSAEEAARVGWLFLRSGRPADAVGWFERALGVDPDNPRAKAGLALARSRM